MQLVRIGQVLCALLMKKLMFKRQFIDLERYYRLYYWVDYFTFVSSHI